MIEYINRREFVAIGAGAALTLGGTIPLNAAEQTTKGKKDEKESKSEKEVGAVEDLMREHGLLRRALLVYTACATKLRSNPDSVSAQALRNTAELFRNFGENYHERKLEEAHIFPVIKKLSSPIAKLPDVLIAQHQRGREITVYILNVSRGSKVATASAESLARALDHFVLMYRNHAAREDTDIFTAWKDALSEKALDEIGERFEDIEHAEFGKDGFESALGKISTIEQSLGLADIAQFTAPPPPKS